MRDLATGIYASHTENDRQQHARDYFWRVIHAYNEVRALPCITAINPDTTAQSRKLDVCCLHYICDVELSSRFSLDNNPQLLDQWNLLVQGQDVPNSVSIIRRCAATYERRELAPATYFRIIKQGRRDRRPAGHVGAA